MPHEMPVFDCPDVMHTNDLPHVYDEASSHMVRCNNFASSLGMRWDMKLRTNEDELVQHGDVHAIREIKSTCKK